MFTLDSVHFLPLIISTILTKLIFLSYWGLALRKQFFVSIVLIPFFLCGLSIVIPYEIISVLVYIFFIGGLIRAFLKFNKTEVLGTLSQYKNYYSSRKRFTKVLIWFCFIHILSGAIGATVLGGEGAIVDAMTYHVGAAKEWALFSNGPKLNTLNPESLTGSYYEYLLYPVFIMLAPLYEFLVPIGATHHEFLSYTLLLTGQLFSVVFSMIFLPWLLYILFKERITFFYIILVLILGMKGMNWVWKTAKNDVFPLFCALTSYSFFLTNFKKKDIRLVTFVSFLTLGVGLGSKLTNLYPMLFILLYIFSKNISVFKKNFSNKEIINLISIAAVAGIVGLLPFLLRNFIETSNPLYPTSSAFFQNIYLTDATEAFHKLYSHPTTWEIAIEKFKRFFLYSPGLILISLLSLYFKKWKEVLFFLFMVAFISKITGERFVWRQVSMILFVVIIWAEELYELYLKKKDDLPKKTGVVVMTLVLALSQFKPERLFKYPIRHYFEEIHEVMPRNYSGWTEQLSENLKHRLNKDYYSSYSSYFSRFRHLNLTDSRPEFRKVKN
jgi:hypothetical protein